MGAQRSSAHWLLAKVNRASGAPLVDYTAKHAGLLAHCKGEAWEGGIGQTYLGTKRSFDFPTIACYTCPTS